MSDTKRVTIAVLIDALGWDALGESKLLADLRVCCRRLTTVLGYSSAAVPSILTGRLPREHGRWSYLYYDPANSPFAWTRPFRFAGPLARLAWVDNPLLKRVIARWTARQFQFDGYFPVYDFPLAHLHLMDHCSKRWDFRPAAFECPSIVDTLGEKGVPAQFLTYPRPEEEIISSCEAGLKAGETAFYFLYLTAIDALGHAHGPVSGPVMSRLRWYDRQLRRLLDLAESLGYEVDLMAFSDHGMIETKRISALKSRIDATRLRFGQDYVAVYDSTMARFWHLAAGSRQIIEECLAQDGQGRVLTEGERRRYGIDFDNDRFGETIYLLRSGTVFYPSHMSRRILKAMHGFDPDDPVNDGVFLSTRRPAYEPAGIVDLRDLLQASVEVDGG